MHVRAVFAGFTIAQPEGSNWVWGAGLWLVAALPFCLTGLGLMARRIPGMGRVRTELLPALGLALFLSIGGLLNLFHVATSCDIWTLLLCGCGASVRALWRAYRAGRTAFVSAFIENKEAWILSVLVAGLMVLALVAQTAPHAYNWQDDLQKYFTHPVRMLETGTVFGSPLSSIGAESLGGIAFVQSCMLLWLPLDALNGADAILGFLLCLIPLFAFGLRNPRLRWVAFLAIASVAIIDPYYVNISALFLGAALIMAVVILTGESDANDGSFSGGSPIAAGLLYAALIALKPTLLLFTGPHLVGVACAVAVARRSLKPALRWGAVASIAMGSFLAPWLLIHLPHYLAPSVPGSSDHPALLHHPIALFSAEPIEPHISGILAYTLLALSLAVLAAVALGFHSKSSRRSSHAVGAAVAAVLAAAAYPFMLFVFPRVVGYADADPIAVRYFIPLALGIFPIALCLASSAVETRAAAFSPTSRLGFCLMLGLIPLVCFGATAAERYRDGVRYGTFLPYPGARDPILADALERALGSAKEAEVRALQDRIPEGASMIAWIYNPYFLDYSRNEIFDAEIAGISNRWGTPPSADYILWEFRGSSDLKARVQHLAETFPAVNRGRVAPMLHFEGVLADQLKTGTVIFRDAQYVLLRTASRH